MAKDERLTHLEQAHDKLVAHVETLSARVEKLVEIFQRAEEARSRPGGLIAGQWHARDGTVYARAALEGSPNAAPLPTVQQPTRRDRTKQRP